MAENRELALVLKLVADQFQQELKNSQSALGQFNNFIKDWKVQLTAAGSALFAVAQSTANFGEEALKGAQKAGITVETFTALSYAAKLANLDQQQLTTGLKTLSVNMVEASQNTGTGEALFRRLGVSATDATGKLRPTEDLLLDLAEVFAKSADGAGKSEAAVKLFGKTGLDLIPFLNQGKSGITALMAEAQRLGVVLSKEDAEAANQFNDQMKTLEAATRGLTLQLGKELLPAFTQLLKSMADLTAGPVGSLFKTEIQGWSAIFTLLNHAIRETGLELEVFLNKMGKSDAVKKFWDDVLVQSRKALDTDTAKKLSQIFPTAPTGTPAPVATTDRAKPQISLGPSKLQADQLKATHDAAEQAEKDRLALVKLGFDRERDLLEASIAEGRTIESDAATSRGVIRQQELMAEAGSFDTLKQLAADYYAARQALGFKDADERLKFETDYQKGVAVLNQQRKVLDASLTAESITNVTAIGQARASELKKSQDLQIQGANLMQADAAKERDDLAKNLEAWMHYADVLGSSTSFMLSKRLDLVRANLAQELGITTDMAEKLLLAEQSKDQEWMASLKSRIAKTDLEIETSLLNAQAKYRAAVNELSGDFIDGWAEGMKRYVKDTQSAFGLSADMARRTFQMIEQSAGKFFFDAMEGRIQSFKDVMTSFLNFAKQISSQLAGQLITKQIAGAFVGGFPSLFGSSGSTPQPTSDALTGSMGGMLVQKFAMGGPVLGTGNRDTVPALLMPGEFVLSRRDVSDIKNGLAGGVSVQISNFSSSEVKASSGGRGPDGQQLVYVTVRDMVKGMIQGGDMDAPMDRRFGLNPNPGRR